jgi:hypothetical protein
MLNLSARDIILIIAVLTLLVVFAVGIYKVYLEEKEYEKYCEEQRELHKPVAPEDSFGKSRYKPNRNTSAKKMKRLRKHRNKNADKA